MISYVHNVATTTVEVPTVTVKNPAQSEPAPPDRYRISLYKPNYIIPFYYTATPDQGVYAGQTPEGQSLKQIEFKFQFSVRVPVLSNIGGMPVTLYGAYTQLSYWQSYVRSPFFRESDYEPAIFFQYALGHPLPWGWQWQSADVGAVHQSNGRGGNLERSWNRIYVGSTLAHNAWTVRVRAWYPIRDQSLMEHNPDIAHYLGYGEFVVSYHRGRQTFSLLSRNTVISGFSRGGTQLSWSFPLVQELHGYVQFYSGYGQSLIEYNHRTEALGIGISLNDY
ncbi:MAG: phospholipase A [Gammaproteobacteria bacterium]|nr:phospholipase A [Gammaproteobacteria bacterium]